MENKKQVPIDPELFQWPADEPRLFGSQCLTCENVTFPAQGSCPKCGGNSVDKIELSSTGTLWTWTSQNFRPKSPYRGDDGPESFQPYYVGYVELPGQVRVETRLAVADESQLRMGMHMELVIIPFRNDDAGNEVMIYAFRPVRAEDQNQRT